MRSKSSSLSSCAGDLPCSGNFAGLLTFCLPRLAVDVALVNLNPVGGRMGGATGGGGGGGGSGAEDSFLLSSCEENGVDLGIVDIGGGGGGGGLFNAPKLVGVGGKDGVVSGVPGDGKTAPGMVDRGGGGGIGGVGVLGGGSGPFLSALGGGGGAVGEGVGGSGPFLSILVPLGVAGDGRAVPGMVDSDGGGGGGAVGEGVGGSGPFLTPFWVGDLAN